LQYKDLIYISFFLLLYIFASCYTHFVAKELQGNEGGDMPQVHFTSSVLQKLKDETGHGTWYSEAGGKGLRLYVGMSGKKTWYVNYRKPGATKVSQHKIGDADLFSVAQAKEAALEFLGAVVRKETPWEKPKVNEALTLEKFIDDVYTQWIKDHRKSWTKTVDMLRSSFSPILKKHIDEISISDIEAWRGKKRTEKGSKASTLNRQAAGLRAALNWAVKRGIIEGHLLGRLERLREDDSETKVRYLLPEERERLFAALDAREAHIKKEGVFADYLKPMIIVALNTGIRRGSLFKLQWRDIDFREEMLTVRAENAKAGKEIHIPMNETLTNALKAWKAQTGGDEDGLVFTSPKGGGVFTNCRRAWAVVMKAADIKKFRWHDMRHDFASQLVIKGVDLNTVRELMGHADLKMTLRYAHLAPKVKRAAVGLLG
jgi:integrase